MFCMMIFDVIVYLSMLESLVNCLVPIDHVSKCTKTVRKLLLSKTYRLIASYLGLLDVLLIVFYFRKICQRVNIK